MPSCASSSVDTFYRLYVAGDVSGEVVCVVEVGMAGDMAGDMALVTHFVVTQIHVKNVETIL